MTNASVSDSTRRREFSVWRFSFEPFGPVGVDGVRLPSPGASLAHRIVGEHASLPRMEATAMNVSDTRTKVEGAEKSSLVTRIADLDETPVLTLVDTSEQSDASEMPDPLIQALVDKLPKPNSVWSNDDRAQRIPGA